MILSLAMNISIVQCNSQAVLLDTGLSSSAFAKSRHSSALEETGLLARVQKGENKQSAGSLKVPHYDFFSYSFDSSEVDVDNEMAKVFFKGEGFNGVTLFELLQKEKSSARLSLAILFVISAINQELQSEVKYLKGTLGAGGIILGTSQRGELTGDVLFLPPKMFEDAAVIQSEEVYSALQGCFVNKSFEESPMKSLSFTLATLAYRAVAGVLPYPALKTELRALDFLDSAFTPIDLVINGIDSNLAFEINSRLTNPQGNFTRDFPIEKFIKELGLEAEPKATDGYVSAIKVPVSHKNMLKEKTFEMKRTHALNLQRRQVKIKRFFRKYSTTVGILSAVVVIVGGLLASYIHDRGKEITTKGLTSLEATKVFYSGLETTDVTIIQNATTGEAEKRFSDTIAGLYVTAKTRTSYDANAATKSLGEWLFYNNEQQYWIYGITNFSLDGKETSFSVIAPEKNSKPAPLSEENGEVLREGSRTEHTAEYYMVYNSAESTLAVVKTTDRVNLLFKGGKWLVSSVESKGEPVEMNFADFKADYEEAKTECGDDVLLLASKLREKYEWICRDDELLKAAKSLYEQYALKSAKKALEER